MVNVHRPYRRTLVIVFLFMMVLSGCSQVSADAPPAGLPAAEDGVVRVAEQAPPIGRPSFGPKQENRPEKLELPAIGVETEVLPIGWHLVTQPSGQQTSEWEVADFAAGWHKNSALPGQGGNVVMSGHNNIKGAIFRKLYTLKEGDMAHVWAGGKRYDYQVEEVMILEERGASLEQRRQNAQWIQPYDDDRLTLVSCWPEDDNSHRVVVVAKRVAE